MENKDLYHEISCAIQDDLFFLHKEEQERNDYIEYMRLRSEELKFAECPICHNIGLEATDSFYSYCSKCKSTIKK